MIALIKTFTLQQTSAVIKYFPGDNKVASSFALAMSAVSEHSLGGIKVVNSFALAHGGYELDGVILDKKLEKTKLIRQK